MEQTTLAAVASMMLIELLDDDEELGQAKRRRGKTRKWMRRRQKQGYYNNLIQQLLLATREYQEMMRMSHETFMQILRKIEEDITPKEIIGGTERISVPERLTVTTRFSATGETFTSLAKQFRISERAVSYIVYGTTNANNSQFRERTFEYSTI